MCVLPLKRGSTYAIYVRDGRVCVYERAISLVASNLD